MKKLLLLPLLLVGLCSCKKKNQTPTEYFSFDADGVHYDYPQIKRLGFGGTGQTLKSAKIGTTSYGIYAHSNKDPVAIGAFTFEFNEAMIPNQDTFIFNTNASVGISWFLHQDINYVCSPPLSGKIIFNERSSTKLSGTFYFDAYKVTYDQNNIRTVTDTILHITNGKFSIIPSN